MCYVCREEIKDYRHFHSSGKEEDRGAQKKCPLYSDTVKLHEQEVARSAAQAREHFKLKNPHIRVDLILVDQKINPPSRLK